MERTHCRVCGEKLKPYEKNLKGMCQPCYKYFVSDKKKVYPLPPLGEITYAPNGDVICPICGRAFAKLGSHIRYFHKLAPKDVYIKVGWDREPHATSKNYKEKMRSHITEELKEGLIERGKNTRFKAGHKGRTRDQMSLATVKRLSKQIMKVNSDK